jgi:hypothetical protein
VPLVLSMPRDAAKGRVDLELIVDSGGVQKHAVIPFVGPR